MGDSCPYGTNMPYDGLLPPVYYFYQAPFALMNELASVVPPILDGMGETWPIFAGVVGVLLYQAQISMVEKGLSYLGIVLTLILGIVKSQSAAEVGEGLFGIGQLMADNLGGLLQVIDGVTFFVIVAPLILDWIASQIVIGVFNCAGFTVILSAWAVISVYEMVYQDVEKGLLMWMNGSVFYVGYAIYGMRLLSP